MKRSHTSFALVGASALGLGALIGLSPLLAGAQSYFSSYQQGSPSYCASAGAYGYSVSTSASSYMQSQRVYFCVSDRTSVPFFWNGSHPWYITDNGGTTIYSPSQSSPPDTYSQGSMIFSDSWDETAANGLQVPPGTYRVVFPNLPGSPSASFVITANPPVAQGTSGGSPYYGTPQPYQPTYYPQQYRAVPEQRYADTRFATYEPAAGASYSFTPGQALTFGGSYFAPYEQISITDTYTGQQLWAQADSAGSFVLPHALTIPGSWSGSTHTFEIRGLSSGYRTSVGVYVGR